MRSGLHDGNMISGVLRSCWVFDVSVHKIYLKDFLMCREGYEGDPFVQCLANPCRQAPCGTNANCQESGTRAVCKCIDGYEGDPFIR